MKRAARASSGPARLGHLLLPLAVAAEIFLYTGSVRAQAAPARDRRRVLLLVDTAGDPFIDRIRSEVVSLGLEVVARPAQGQIEARARAEHAVAAVRILPSRNGVEVWMADATSGRSLLRHVIVDETPGGPNQDVVALQTAELLRTGLFAAPSPAPTNAAPAGAAPIVVQNVPPRSSAESGLRTGVELLYSAGGASPAWQAWLSFQHVWSRRVGCAVDVSAPFRRGVMSGPEGTADVGAIVAGAQLFARFVAEGERIVFTTGLGAGFVSLLTDGHPSQLASAQLESNSSTAYTGLGYARITLAWKPSAWLGMGMSGFAGATVARVHVRFAGNGAGEWGVPLLGAALFAQVDWR